MGCEDIVPLYKYTEPFCDEVVTTGPAAARALGRRYRRYLRSVAIVRNDVAAAGVRADLRAVSWFCTPTATSPYCDPNRANRLEPSVVVHDRESGAASPRFDARRSCDTMLPVPVRAQARERRVVDGDRPAQRLGEPVRRRAEGDHFAEVCDEDTVIVLDRNAPGAHVGDTSAVDRGIVIVVVPVRERDCVAVRGQMRQHEVLANEVRSHPARLERLAWITMSGGYCAPGSLGRGAARRRAGAWRP